MAKYNVFETTNLRATKYAERIFDAVATVDVENGTFGYLDGQADGYIGDVVYKFVPGTKEGLRAHELVVANNPAWNADTTSMRNQRRDQYVIEAGVLFRAEVLHEKDEFATAIEGFTTATRSIVTEEDDFIENDVYVTIDSSTGKYVASTTAPDEGELFVGRIMRKRLVGGKLVTPGRTYGDEYAMYDIKVEQLN